MYRERVKMLDVPALEYRSRGRMITVYKLPNNLYDLTAIFYSRIQKLAEENFRSCCFRKAECMSGNDHLW